MSDNLRSKIGIQERGLERDFPKGFYVGQTFPLTKVNESDVFKCYATISGELELLTDFSPDVEVGKYAHSEASEVIRLQPGQAAIVTPNVVLQQRGHGEMAVLYFSSKVTKNERTYALRPERQVILVPDEQGRRMFTFLSDYSRCGWRGEYSFRIIEQLLEMVDTEQARREVDDFLMSAIIKVQGRPIHVYNTHLSACGGAFAQTREVFEIRAQVNRDEDSPRDFAFRHVLMGDFNVGPNSTPYRAIRLGLFLDAWREMQGDAPGNTFDTFSPHARIDYILVGSGGVFKVEYAQVTSKQTLFDVFDLVKPNAGRDFNNVPDHLPVVAHMSYR